MDEKNIIKTLTENGGNLWKKNGMRRIYFDSKIITDFSRLEVTRYNTGNISSATLDGEKISNSAAGRIISALLTVKIYYDIADNEFHIKYNAGSFGSLGDAEGMTQNWFKHMKTLLA